MAYLIGTDEAGYGPNLGPLVIGATMWRVPEGMDGQQLYQHLPGIRSQTAPASTVEELVIGDSKTLYRPGGGLTGLERGVFAALSNVEPNRSVDDLSTWRELLVHCDNACSNAMQTIPWYAAFDCPVPIDASRDDIALSRRVLARALEASGIELVSVCARLIFPQAFNQRIRDCGSKGQALSLWTLELVAQLLQSVCVEPVLIESDKHGGRNRYAALLQHVFPDHLIQVRQETRRQSRYVWGPAERRVEARFTAKGDRFLPSALASMVAKYLRELAMLAFNRFWQDQLPTLRATAGYPVDARRFRSEIDARQRRLGIDDQLLWRAR